MLKKVLCLKQNSLLKKALSLGHRPIVVINKIDKPGGDPDRVIDEVFDLFAQMDATEESN